MIYPKPLYTEIKCRFCGKKSELFAPDGIDGDYMECPKCQKPIALWMEVKELKEKI